MYDVLVTHSMFLYNHTQPLTFKLTITVSKIPSLFEVNLNFRSYNLILLEDNGVKVTH